ncbi:MAG: SusD/RagB family nutrient-binding outer membrane lipoprotein [Candidatus Longimicrobiales bacterium M2_2A_002]
MKTIRNLLLLVFLVPILGGCDDPFDLDINTDPDAATEVEADLLFPTVLTRISSVRSIEIGPGQAFFTQIWASNGSAGVFIDPERYIISSFTTGNSWGIVYNDALKNLLLARDQALEEEPVRPNVAAQSEILSAYGFWMLTAMWGDVPFTEALNGDEFPDPSFDEQEVVLRGLVDKIDAALALIDPNAGPGVGFGDLVYEGDMENWERFGNSLKLRILMMIRNQDPSVDSEIAALLNEPLIRTNSQEAAIPFFDAANNENNVWRLNDLFAGFVGAANGNGFIFAGETLVELMKSLDDPRLSTYFEYAVDFDDGTPITNEYFGQTAGVLNYGDETSMISQNIIRPDWPSRMITATEVWLYEAEFLAATGDLPGADAAYEAGVQAALDFFDGKPGDIPEADEAAYLASLPDLTGLGQAAALDEIRGQQYIEVFDRAPENWVHWKRTHYPALPLPNEAVLGDIIRRYPYPPDELSANPNAPSQVQLATPMWFEPAN